MAGSAIGRLAFAFGIDALISASLSGLLIWGMAVKAARRDEIGRQLDDLLNLQCYGPLSEEDREVIRERQRFERVPAAEFDMTAPPLRQLTGA